MHRGSHSIEDLSRQTGYTAKTVRAHLSRLQEVGLVQVNGNTVQTTNRSLKDAAEDLALDGIGLARQFRHQLEREAYAWWTDELRWRKEGGKTRFPGRRRTSGTASTETRAYESRRQRYGRFPMAAPGRSDFAAALRVVRDHSRGQESEQDSPENGTSPESIRQPTIIGWP
ncbi:helix-turn-helix domain-containing protein [Actinoplanes siamensis]|uniref:HTH arsR-type domain-containing protein n=1 Tax=Actinoplanes siamensis TaxID=1223317 RepID=A0A919NEF3_9ACTN|nr:helix-turn-helix domain-containing protein [Actinoplanes siamensis]GIF09378.1 hypothetical protein Asi03nite_69160 [Actinoplanes siamensis]